MPARDPVLIAYDIVDDASRKSAFDALRGFGVDAQLSVHECLFTQAERREIWERLVALAGDADKILMLNLDPRAKVERLGVAREPEKSAVGYIG